MRARIRDGRMGRWGAVVTVVAAVGVAGVATALGDYAGTVFALQPTAYWRLNETAPVPVGNRAWNDGSLGWHLDGFYNGSALHPVKGALAGGNNSAAGFDGTSGCWVSVANLPELSPVTAFTVECWVNPYVARVNDDDAAAPFACLRRTTTDASGWIVYQLASAWNFRMGNRGGYVVNLNSTTVPRLGKWDHLAAVFDGTSVHLFVNGVLESSGTLTAPYQPNLTTPLAIGARGDDGFRFNGLVDEAAVYPTALAEEDVEDHFLAGINPLQSPGYAQLVLESKPLVYYRLGEGPYSAVNGPPAQNSGSLGQVVNGRYAPGATNAVPGPRPTNSFHGFSADNRAVELCGAGGLVRTPYQFNFLEQFSAIGWVRRGTAHTGRGGIFGQQGLLELGEADGGTSLELRVGVYGEPLRVTYPFAPNQWGFIAVVADGQQVVLYTNTVLAGVLEGEVQHYGSAGATLNIGGEVFAGPGDWFRGAVDEVAVFHRALSAAEVRALHDAAGVPPQIIANPQAPPFPVSAGNVVTLGVASIGTPPLSYRWRKGGTVLPFQTLSNLVFNPVRTNDTGAYDVVVQNSYGAVTSRVTQLTVTPPGPPTILVQPQSHTRFVSRAVQFAVTAGGTPPLTYQWQFNGANLSGQTGPTLDLSNLSTGAEGRYRVVVKNHLAPAGVVSEEARLTVVSPSSYAAAVLADGPMAYWQLGETNGPLANDAWGGHDGLYVAVGLGQPGYSAADSDPAAEFAPERDTHVSVATADDFNFNGPTVSLTIEAWVRFRSVSGLQRICSNRHTPAGIDGGYAFGLKDSQTLRFTAFGSIDIDSPPIEPPLLAGKWYHLAVVVAESQVTFYVNGRPPGTAYPLLNGILSSPEPFQLGRNPQVTWGEDELDGWLDEVAVFPRALAPARLEAHYHARDNGRVPPEFTVQPVAAQSYSGRARTFTAVAEGSEPIRYQWFVNGLALSGATSETLTWSAIPGTYTLRSTAAGPGGTAHSTNATFKVDPPPTECDLREDLVLHLALNGNVQDSSGRGNHGTVVGTPTFVQGRIGGAALEYRTDANAIPKVFDYVTLGKLSDLLFGTNVNFTVAFWTKFSGLPGNLPWLANNLESTGDAGFAIGADLNAGGWAWSLNDARAPKAWGGVRAAAPTINSLNDNHWHHLAFTFDRAGNAVTYIDGVAFDTTSLRPAIGWQLNTGHPVNLGQASGTFPASGEFQIDDLGVWRRALSDYEVDTMFLVGNSLGRSFAPDQPTRLVVEILRVPDLDLVEVTWNGQARLETALRPDGTWITVTNAVSPYLLEPVGLQQYFRVRQ